MAGKGEAKLSMMLRFHNMTCPIHLLGLGPLKKVEPGCRMLKKHREQKPG